MTTLTLTLTEEEANALHDLLGWAGDHIGEILDDAKHDPEPDENDKEVVEIYEPLADICLRVGALIEAETTERVIMGKPHTCPRCGEDGRKPPHLLEHTGSDAHCDHEEERNFSCDNCGCRFTEVWAYSRKEIERDPMASTPEEVERWAEHTKRVPPDTLSAWAEALPTKTIPQFPPADVPYDEKEEERYRNHGPTDLQDHLSSFSVETLCDAFIEVIRDHVMQNSAVIEIDRLNAAETDALICHTHDFCDANMSMLEAWERVVNTVDGEQLEDGDDGYVDMDCQDRDIAYLVNRAWTMAKAKGFSCPDFYHPTND